MTTTESQAPGLRRGSSCAGLTACFCTCGASGCCQHTRWHPVQRPPSSWGSCSSPNEMRRTTPAHQNLHCRGPTETTEHRRLPPDCAVTQEKTGQRRPSTREQRQERGNSAHFVDGANQHLPRDHTGVELRGSSPLPVELQRRGAEETMSRHRGRSARDPITGAATSGSR